MERQPQRSAGSLVGQRSKQQIRRKGGDGLVHPAQILTPNAREAFFAAFEQRGNVTEAAKAIGIGRRRIYEVRESDPEFAARWKEAEQIAADTLEREAWRRAVEGVNKPIMYKGQVVEHVTEYSDQLLERLLEAHRPEKYRRPRDGDSGVNLTQNNTVIVGQLKQEFTIEQLRAMAAQLGEPQ